MAGFRHFIIKTAEVMMIVIVILTAISFAISGAGVAQAALGGNYWIVGVVAGFIVGFLFAAIFAAYFFLLAEVAENTRRIP